MVRVECKLCNESLAIEPENPKTYISKKESGNALIGKLFTYRVSHDTENYHHINVIVLDQNGEYRAHKDYYKEVKETDGSAEHVENVRNIFPIELKPYISLASANDREIISSKFNLINKSTINWYKKLKHLKQEHSKNVFFDFIYVKWSFIVGKHNILKKREMNPKLWSFPLLLRLKARFEPSSDLVEKIQSLDNKNLPRLIQIEKEIAKSEIFLRLGETELLEQLFKNSKEKWGIETSIETKSGMMLIQSYYSFGLTTLGRINKALELIKPAFNLGQILDNREIISVAGNFYAAILQAAGELDKALKIYNIVLQISKEIGDERMQAVVSINISIIESKQGFYDKALKRQKSILDLPIVQEEFFLRSSLISIIGETLFIAERYEESIEMCKKILLKDNVSTYYKSQALSTLKKIAGKTGSKSLLDFVDENLLEDEDFLNSPMGKIFKFDLEAIKAELDDDWKRMIDNLERERTIMIDSKSLEDVSDIEIRLARGYFKLYQDSNDLEELNQSYNHLDLAKAIALDNQSYLDLSRLTTLKGLLALENKASSQAIAHFQEALKIAEKHNLDNMEKTIQEHLDQVNKGLVENSDSMLKKLFRVLSFRKQEELSQPRKESTIFSIYISKLDSSWEQIFLNQNKGDIGHIRYLEGFCDLLEYIQKNVESQTVKYLSSDKGSVIVENAYNFQLVAYCDNVDYMTRLTIQEILPSLNEFNYKNIPIELRKKSLEILNEKLDKFDYFTE